MIPMDYRGTTKEEIALSVDFVYTVKNARKIVLAQNT